MPGDAPIDLTDHPTTLVYITKLPGNGYVAGYGWLKQFAFSIPEALRRLADSIDHAPAKTNAPAAAEDSIASLDLDCRALGGVCRGHDAQSGVSYSDARKLHWRTILTLRPRQIKNFGEVSYARVSIAMHERGLTRAELEQSRWWIAAPGHWRSRVRINLQDHA